MRRKYQRLILQYLKAQVNYIVIFRQNSFDQVAVDMQENGGSVMYVKHPFQVIRGEWLKAGRDFPFVVIPQR